ncbi:MAG: hypothetical protein IJS28_01590 [Synergistaceae bacterium]|nr:hypothetical protein [Synergistaceae bacterium]
MNNEILRVNNLYTSFLKAAHGASFTVNKGETPGMVSTTCCAAGELDGRK